MKINYHTHTTRCNHARDTEREYVESAIANGFKVLGFSEHTPYPFDGDNYQTGMRMRMDELASYVNTVLSLKKEYEKDIEIHLGLEVEYFPRFFDDFIKAVSQYPIEYFLLAQHFLGNGEKGRPSCYDPATDLEALKEYCSLLTQGMNTGRFTYLAHPDLIRYTGDEALYGQYMRELCRAANANQVPVEINLLGIRENRLYPRDAFWKIAAEENCQVFWGVDAHSADTFAHKDSMDRAMELVRKYNLNLLDDVTLKSPF